jgi:hypothetical protein
MQRAIEILRIEHGMNEKKYKKHLQSLEDPYVDTKYSLNDDIINGLKNNQGASNEFVENILSGLDYMETELNEMV